MTSCSSDKDSIQETEDGERCATDRRILRGKERALFYCVKAYKVKGLNLAGSSSFHEVASSTDLLLCIRDIETP